MGRGGVAQIQMVGRRSLRDLVPPWPAQNRPRIVDQSGSEVCQFSSATRGTFLGRRPLVPPAQGIALGHHTPTPSVSRPNGPTDSTGRQLACPAAKDYDHRPHDRVLGLKGEPLARWADRVYIVTWFPRALPWAWRIAPLRGGDGLRGGTEPECNHQEYALEFCAGQFHPACYPVTTLARLQPSC